MTQTMIEVRDLTRRYGEVRALNGVSFQVSRGQVVGLLGPNGAGKSTCMRILTGFVAPTSGSASVAGHDVVEDPLEARRRIGYLPEGNPLYPELRIEEALAFAARMHGLAGDDRKRAIGRSIERAGLQGMGRRTIGTFSKGYRQRVGLAQALLHEPDLLILDEPTSGLDPNQQEEMRALIRSLGAERTVVLSTHILPEVEAVCGRALIISQGHLVADGSIEEIRAQVAGAPTVSLTVRADAGAVGDLLAGLGFAHDVQVLPLAGEPGLVQARLRVGEGDRRRQLEEVAAAVHARGFALSELRRDAATLGQVFAELTAGDRLAPAAEGVLVDVAAEGA
jgi:ABC-2 type transport system ATP-binding protein